MDISVSDSFALVIAAIPIFLLLLWVSFFLLFLLVDYCKLYLYTSLFDSLYFLICGCSPQHRYDIDRANYQRQLKIDKRLKDDKSTLEGTLHILLFSDVDIYTPHVSSDFLQNIVGKVQNNSKDFKNGSQYHTNMKYSSQSLFNWLKLKYGPDFTQIERKCYADYLLVHVVKLFLQIIEEIQNSDAKLEKESNTSIAKELSQLSPFEKWAVTIINKIPIECLNAIWNDAVFQKYYLQEKQKGMSDCLDFIFEKEQLKRITQKEFLPTNTDIEKMHIVVPEDHTLKTNAPVMKVIINISEKRKIKITQFSMKFFKLKYKLGSEISDICDFAIFIGRLDANTNNFIMDSSKAMDISKDTDLNYKNLPNIIFLDDLLLSSDKFQSFINCFTNINLRKDMNYFKHAVATKITSIPSAVFNTIVPTNHRFNFKDYMLHMRFLRIHHV